MRKIVWMTLLFFSCQSKNELVETPLFPVRTAIAESRDVPIFLEGLGHVQSMNSIAVRSRIEGELTGVYFTQGQEVKRGDLLFTIDPKPYQAILNQAQGKLAQNRANYLLTQDKVKRYKALLQDEYFSQIDFETLQTNLATNEGLIQENQAEVDRAAIDLDYCWIYAPIDGMTGILQIDLGNLVSADGQKALITLNQMAPIFVTFSIPEIQLPQIQKWMHKSNGPLPVVAAYESFLDEVFQGSLTMIDNQVDKDTGMIKLRATFENSKRELWPGQFIRTRLLLHTEAGAVLIPQTSIQATVKGPIAYVVNDDNTVEARSLTLGQRQDEQVIVLEGIRSGEKIVTEGQINLFNGAKVMDINESL